MKSLLTRKQTLVTLSLLSGIFVSLYVLVAYLAANDTYLETTSWFNLTVWQLYLLIAKPFVIAATVALTPLGVVLLVMSRSKRQLSDFGILSLLVGVICAVLAWPLF